MPPTISACTFRVEAGALDEIVELKQEVGGTWVARIRTCEESAIIAYRLPQEGPPKAFMSAEEALEGLIETLLAIVAELKQIPSPV